MKISFIIPVYNCCQHLNNCLQKIRDVKLLNYEIILIDDGSTDDSSVICDEWVSKYKEIKCIHQQNQGVSAARNRGLDMATGDYVIFFDADDSFDPEQLHTLIQKLEIEPNIDMAIFGMSFDYYHKRKIYRRDKLKTPLAGIYDREIWMGQILELYRENSLSPIWNKIFRRDLLNRKKLYLREDMFIYEDLEFSLRCMLCCKYILFEPAVIYQYRQSEDEGNAGRRLKRIEHISIVVNQIEKVLNDCMDFQNSKALQEKKKELLLVLYVVLAKEKISISNKKEILVICDDFTKWYRDKNYQSEDMFINKLLNHQVTWLITKRVYISIRHKIAIAVKNTFLYQKWRGQV